MELKQLEYFLALAQELHFTKAAEKVGISQPSLRQQIRILEAEIGMPLFDRIGKKTALTEAGHILRSHSQRVFHELAQAWAAIRELQGIQRGRLSIGSLLTVSHYLLPPAIFSFHEQYPGVELSVLAMRTGDIRAALLENQLDMGIVFLPMLDEELESHPLATEELILAFLGNKEVAAIPFSAPIRREIAYGFAHIFHARTKVDVVNGTIQHQRRHGLDADAFRLLNLVRLIGEMNHFYLRFRAVQILQEGLLGIYANGASRVIKRCFCHGILSSSRI